MGDISTDPASGTRDFLPAEMAGREHAFATIRRSFASHGFEPLDTPAFERLDVLTGKYGEEGDKLIFKILKRGDQASSGDADLALRYDLTVPLARVVARYGSQLPQPFKRYHLAPVWRADRPGHGRYREFLQCDVDTVGSDSRLADAETLITMADTIDALGLGGFTIQLNSRRALRGLVQAYGVDVAAETDLLVALDKLDKIGLDGVAGELRDRGIPTAAIELLQQDLGADDAAGAIRDRLAGTEDGPAGLAEIDEVLALTDGQIRGGRIIYAPVLARGLSYYTGPVFEFVHDDLDATIAAGGRYDGLIGMFSGSDVPATGCSLGLERILLILADREIVSAAPQVLVTVMDQDGRADALAVARQLRDGGIDADVYVDDAKLGKQIKYADRRGIAYVVIRGESERDAATVAVKQLATGDQTTVPLDDLVAHLTAAGAPAT